MNTSIAADLPCALHRRLRAQVGSTASVDTVPAMRSFAEELRRCLPVGATIELDDPRSVSAMRCRSQDLVDLLLALFAWAKARSACTLQSEPQRTPHFKIRVQDRGPELEIAIWEAHPARLCVHSLTLWSQLGAKVEQLGARMQVEAPASGQWRRFWLERWQDPANRVFDGRETREALKV